MSAIPWTAVSGKLAAEFCCLLAYSTPTTLTTKAALTIRLCSQDFWPRYLHHIVRYRGCCKSSRSTKHLSSRGAAGCPTEGSRDFAACTGEV